MKTETFVFPGMDIYFMPRYALNSYWKIDDNFYMISKNKIVKVELISNDDLDIIDLCYNNISEQISAWAEENGIDLSNLTEEDKVLIVMKWANRFVIAPP